MVLKGKGLEESVEDNFEKVGDKMKFEFIIAAASDARGFALTQCRWYSVTEFT